MAAVTAAVLLLWPRPHLEKRDQPSSEVKARAAGVERSGAIAAAVAPRGVGELSRYAIEMASEVTVRGAKVLAFELTGTWDLGAVRTGASGTTLRGSLAGSSLRGKTGDPKERAELGALEPSLELPCFFTVEPDGTISNVRTAPRMPSLVQGIVKWIVAAMQMVEPAEDASTWSAVETDTTGRYQATYEALAGWGRVEKRKVRYLEALRGAQHVGQDARRTEVESSLTVFELDRSGRLMSLSADEATRIASDGPLPAMRATTRLRLRLVGSKNNASLLEAWSAEYKSAEAAPLDAPATAGARRADIDRAKVAGLTLGQILARWKGSQGTDRDAKTERARLYVALAALLRQDGAALREVVTRIRGGDALADLFIDALGDAGTAEAQAALVDLFEHGGLEPKQERALLIAMSLLDSPTEETISALQAWLEDPKHGRQASYALGASVHQLEGSDPERAQVALKALLDRLGQARSSATIMRMLEALGNAGSEAALPAIEPYLARDDASVRGAAVRALRRMPAGPSDTLLAQAMTRDSSAAVRGVAARVAEQRQRTAPLVAAVDAAARLEPETSVRFTSVRVLVRWMGSNPDLVGTARWVANNDPNQQIRDFASKALERRSG